jgi:hypothetical protein
MTQEHRTTPTTAHCETCCCDEISNQRCRGRCEQPCDHCRPDAWHQCQLAHGHTGMHTCSGNAQEWPTQAIKPAVKETPAPAVETPEKPAHAPPGGTP